MKQTGDKYFDSEEFQKLLKEYETSVNAGEPVFMDVEELVDIADYYQYTNRKDEADRVISLASSLSPDDASYLTYRIHESLFQGNTEKAWEYLDQMLEKDEPDYIYNRTEILLSEERFDEANEYLEEIFQEMPADERQDFLVDIANIFVEYNRPGDAMRWMKEAKQEDTTDFKELKARTLFGLGKYKDSQKLFNELLDTNPFSTSYWNALASAQFMNEDFSEAIKSSEYAIAIDPEDSDSLMAKANALYRLGNYEEAIKFYEKYFELVPNDEFPLLYIGTSLINLQRTEEAIETLKKALEITPEDSPNLCDIYQELAFAYSENKETDKALEVIEKTDALDCDHVQMLLIKGHILLAAERSHEAKEVFRKVLRITNTPKQTLLRVIVSYYDNRYLEGAYNLLKNYLTTYEEMENGKNTEGYAYMALCCYEMKKLNEFLTYLKEACKRNPHECRIALSHLFPEEVKPEDYYQYIKEKLNIEE